MADEIKHQHTPNDIIIKDQDGTYKILRDGKFVPLDEAEAKAHHIDAKPAAAPTAAAKSAAPAFPSRIPVKQEPKPVEAKAVPAPTRSSDPTEQQAEAILQKTALTFASGEIRARVKNVLVSHLKGIRKPFETKLFLIKGVRDGGAGLTEQEAEVVLMAASGHKVLSAANQGIKPEPPNAKPSLPIGKEVSLPATVAVDKPMMADPSLVQPLEPSKPVGPAFAPQPSLADVQKPMRALGGMVDQLSYDLMTWRRLGQEPKDRIKKIETQLDVLEQDGYPERLKGLLAWHGSEVVRKYIEAGKKSVESNGSLPQTLGNGSDTELSFAEWQAIAELNSRIRP